MATTTTARDKRTQETTNFENKSAAATVGGKRGIDVLHDPTINKATAYTEAERQALGPAGLVPDVTDAAGPQLRRVLM